MSAGLCCQHLLHAGQSHGTMLLAPFEQLTLASAAQYVPMRTSRPTCTFC